MSTPVTHHLITQNPLKLHEKDDIFVLEINTELATLLAPGEDGAARIQFNNLGAWESFNRQVAFMEEHRKTVQNQR